MLPLRWRTYTKDIRIADGYDLSHQYQLVRLDPQRWEAWFVEAEKRQKIGRGNFVQARATATKHYQELSNDRNTRNASARAYHATQQRINRTR